MPRAWRTEKFFVLRRLLQREDRDTREPRHLNPRAPAGGQLAPPGEAAHRGRLFAGRHQFVHEGVETLHIVHYTFGPCPRMTRYTTADTTFLGCTSTRTLWRQVAQQCSWATPSTGGGTASPRPSQTARRNGPGWTAGLAAHRIGAKGCRVENGRNPARDRTIATRSRVRSDRVTKGPVSCGRGSELAVAKPDAFRGKHAGNSADGSYTA